MFCYCCCCLMRDFGHWENRRAIAPRLIFLHKRKSEKTDHLLSSHLLVMDEICDGFDCTFLQWYVLILFLGVGDMVHQISYLNGFYFHKRSLLSFMIHYYPSVYLLWFYCMFYKVYLKTAPHFSYLKITSLFYIIFRHFAWFTVFFSCKKWYVPFLIILLLRLEICTLNC